MTAAPTCGAACGKALNRRFLALLAGIHDRQRGHVHQPAHRRRRGEDVHRTGAAQEDRADGHAVAVGRALDTAVGKYNQFVGSLESQVMVSARRFEDLKVDHEGKDLPELPPVEQSPRTLSRPELLSAPVED